MPLNVARGTRVGSREGGSFGGSRSLPPIDIHADTYYRYHSEVGQVLMDCLLNILLHFVMDDSIM